MAMFYQYRCPNCLEYQEMYEEMNAPHIPPMCGCGTKTYRVYNAQIIADEFKSGHGFNPQTRREEKYHGDHFDIGLGEWIRSKSHRKEVMKKKGLSEHPDAHKEVSHADT